MMLVRTNTSSWRILLNATFRRANRHAISHWTYYKVCQNRKGTTRSQQEPNQNDRLLHSTPLSLILFRTAITDTPIASFAASSRKPKPNDSNANNDAASRTALLIAPHLPLCVSFSYAETPSDSPFGFQTSQHNPLKDQPPVVIDARPVILNSAVEDFGIAA